MKKYFRDFVYIVLFLIIISSIIRYCNHRRPVDKEFYENNLKGSFKLYIAFKNNGRRWGLYMVKTLSDVKKIEKMNFPIGDPYNVPKYPDIEFSIQATNRLLDAAVIGNKIEKLPNSNKCYLYKGDSVYRYNCYFISENDRKQLGEIEEWNVDEIGYWKVIK